MLVCDHGSDPSQVARHLVEDANVPVIIGASFSSTTLQIFDDVAHAANVLVLSPSATSPALTTHPDDGLLWRTAPSDVVQAELLKFLAVDVEHALQQRNVLPAGKNAKIAMPTKNDSAGLGLAAAATSINPDSPTPAPVVDVGLPDQYPNPDAQPANQPVDWKPHIQSILDYTPDIILAMGTGEFVINMMPAIEGGWDPSLPRPWYLLPEGDRVSQLTDWVAQNPGYGLSERILGTAPGARRSALYEGFRTRFLMAFNQREPGNLAEFGYDAGYLVAYAIAIANQPEPSGRQLAEAMKQMSCLDRAPVPAGPGSFSGYFTTAARVGCINFDGASGPLDFNPDTGEALSDIAMWCVRPTTGANFSFEPTLDSYYSVEQSAVAVVPGKAPLDLSANGWCKPAP